MGLFGPGKPTANHTAGAVRDRQLKAQMKDANKSAHPNKTTVADLQARKR